MNESRTRGPPAGWDAILQKAITTPGLIHEAYQRFHRYSLRNQLLAMFQCMERGITPGPIATYKQWEALGRHVLRGQKAIVLCMPITSTRPRAPATTVGDDEDDVEPTNDDHDSDKSPRVFFMYQARWFVISQTDGDEYQPTTIPSWSEDRALQTLGVGRIRFDHLDGNVQGYATPHREIAINPIAALPHKTLFHELAHILLEHAKDENVPQALREVEAEGVALLCCEALNLPGIEYARGYLRHWLSNNELTTKSSERIIATAHRIIAAGREDS